MIGPAAAGSAGPVLTPVFLTDRAIASSSAAAQLRRWINFLSSLLFCHSPFAPFKSLSPSFLLISFLIILTGTTLPFLYPISLSSVVLISSNLQTSFARTRILQ